MVEAAPGAMTADEFVHWDDGSDTRYELVDGVVVAMAPATDVHGGIVGNAWGEIDSNLRRHPVCWAIVEAGVRLDERNHFKADVAGVGRVADQLAQEDLALLVERVDDQIEHTADIGLERLHGLGHDGD